MTLLSLIKLWTKGKGCGEQILIHFLEPQEDLLTTLYVAQHAIRINPIPSLNLTP